jgi:two-component system response regulator YesN
VLSKTRDLEELRAEVRGIVAGVCRMLGNLKKDDRLALEIKAFVETSYGDVNLSISMIAEHFGLTQGYISRLFKEMTGEGLLEHIGRTRVAVAKKLMGSRRAPLAEVASAVGYTSANALIRAFKRHEGITPGRYRELG